SVHLRQPRPRFASLPHGQLLPKRQVLEREVAVRAKTASQGPNEGSEPSDHDREIADQSAKCKFIAQDDFLEGTGHDPRSLVSTTDHPKESISISTRRRSSRRRLNPARLGCDARRSPSRRSRTIRT